MTRFALALLVAVAVGGVAQARTIAVGPGPDAQERLQTALLDAKPGDVVRMAAGRYDLTDGLSLDVDSVTVKGAGPDATVLSFAGQKGAGEGLLITSDGVTVRDFAVEDTRGDGIKSKGADQISFLNLRVEWTGGPKPTNGAYGVYPVSSSNVLIDRVVVRGASDAGIYVGQSRNIVVKRSRAEFNVAGIEIENSMTPTSSTTPPPATPEASWCSTCPTCRSWAATRTASSATPSWTTTRRTSRPRATSWPACPRARASW